MTRDSSRARTARWRRRLAGLPDPDAPPPCTTCGRLVKSARTVPLCSRCWKRTPEGREFNRDRMRAARARAQASMAAKLVL